MRTEIDEVVEIMERHQSEANRELCELVERLRAQSAPVLTARIAELERQAEDLDERLHAQTLAASRLAVQLDEMRQQRDECHARAQRAECELVAARQVIAAYQQRATEAA